MAVKFEAVVQKILVPNGSINKEPHYRDYGWQYIWLYNMDNDPPTVIMSGVTPSGRLEIDSDGTCEGIAGYQPQEGGNRGYQELIPIVKHIPGIATEEAFGMLTH